MPFRISYRSLQAGLILLTLGMPGYLVARSSGPEQVSGADRLEATALYKQSLKQGDVEAVRMLLRAAKLNGTDAEIQFRLGYLYHKMNYREEAIQHYRRTLEIRTCHKKALVNLGNLYSDRNETDEARSLYQKAIECAPDFYAGYYNLALIDSNNRVSLLEKALSLKADHFGSNYLLAKTYYDRDAQRGLKMMEHACALKENHPGCLRELGELYLQAGQKEKARSTLKRALFLSKHPVERREIRLKLQSLDAS
ncbi:MAG: tetratricopeptide repeat protein [Leptospiraceae bacterium]|nr:tetratricopeptide repeat protein [Leptospiraceae bacterium]